jgi:hypothetical protein
MPAAGTCSASLFISGHVFLSQRLSASTDILLRASACVQSLIWPPVLPGIHLRHDVGPGPGRRVLDVIVAGHVLGDHGHRVPLSRELQGRGEA